MSLGSSIRPFLPPSVCSSVHSYICLSRILNLDVFKALKFVKSIKGVQVCFMDLSRMFQGCFKNVSKVFQGCFKVLHSCFKNALRVFQGCFKDVWRMVQRCFKVV